MAHLTASQLLELVVAQRRHILATESINKTLIAAFQEVEAPPKAAETSKKATSKKATSKKPETAKPETPERPDAFHESFTRLSKRTGLPASRFKKVGFKFARPCGSVKKITKDSKRVRYEVMSVTEVGAVIKRI